MVKPSIHHLPPEILSLVFKACWDDGKEKEKFCLEKSINHPLLLSISFPGAFRSRSRIHVPLVREALRHSHRWKQADFHMPDPEGLFDFPDALPILESLKVKTWPFRWTGFHDYPIPSPRLRILRLDCVEDVGLDLTSLRLSHFKLGPCYISVVFNILRSCNGLTRHSFSQDENDELIPLEPHLHITTSLDSLKGIGLCHDVNVFFQILTLPRLQHLILSGGSILFPDADFRQFLTRSRPPPTTLKVSGYSMEGCRFTEMLTLVPSIETLLIQNPYSFYGLDPIIDASFLNRLTFPHKDQSQRYEDSMLLPILADLTLDFEGHRFGKERLLTMVKSRCLQENWKGGVTGWKRLRILDLKCAARDLDVYHRSCLEDLQKSGLKLTFEFSDIEPEA
ncbi:hypothetical protein Moror_9792 [Moniliophthora roreri MCA 2997]|nr:hypothetical protein Moror_9792 [Moniliophthora roreri MCA 2997]